MASIRGMWANSGGPCSQGLVDQDLPGGVGDVVFTPDDVGDCHGDVIHHHREIVGGDAVGALDHQVVQFLVVKGDGAFDPVMPMGDAGMAGLEAHRGIRSGRQVKLPAAAVVFGFLPPGQGRLAARFESRRAVAIIGRTVGQQALDIVLINGQPF